MSSVLTKPTAVVVSGKAVQNQILASENVPIYTIITSTGYIANSATIAHISKIAGITKEAITATDSGSVITAGEIENVSWTWTRGDILFLNGTAIANTPPSTGFRVIIGEALSTTKILVRISEPILL